MRTHNTGNVSSIPPCVKMKMLLVRKATGNQLMNLTSLEKTQSPVSGFYYTRNRVCSATQSYRIALPCLPHFLQGSLSNRCMPTTVDWPYLYQ